MTLLPQGARRIDVDTSAGRLSVLTGGAGDALPVLLIHGGGYDAAGISWWRLFAPLAAQRHVIAPDLPGFGGSIGLPPVGGPVEMAALVAEVMAATDVPRAIVAGVSMGGDVALNLALMSPERVAGLVLIAPGGLAARVGTPAAHRAAWLAAKLPDWALRPLTRLANRYAGAALKGMVHDPATIPAPVADAFVEGARHPEAGWGYGRYNQATIGPDGLLNDLSNRVGEITVPTLFFHGADDKLVDPANSRAAASRMPNARLVLVPDCGHWAQIEAHDRFLVELTAFIAARG